MIIMDITLTMTYGEAKKLQQRIDNTVWRAIPENSPIDVGKQRVIIPLISIVDVDGNHHCSLDPERDIKLIKDQVII